MKLIKTCACLLLVFCLAVSLCGCKKNDGPQAAEICNSLASSLFKGQATVTLNGEQLKNYFTFEYDALKEYHAVMLKEEEKYGTVAVFVPKDKSARQALTDGIITDVSNAANLYKAISQNEYKKIQNRLLYQKDGIVILVICDNYEAAEKYLKQINAKPIK